MKTRREGTLHCFARTGHTRYRFGKNTVLFQNISLSVQWSLFPFYYIETIGRPIPHFKATVHSLSHA